jgi:hypothetical protein
MTGEGGGRKTDGSARRSTLNARRLASTRTDLTVSEPGSGRASRRPFVEPELAKHEPLTRITLVSEFGGGGGGQGTFFG